MVFDKYFSLPAALARHRSAPLARERERFLTHLEAGGTGRQTIRTAACYLLQVIQILGLRRLRDVTLGFKIPCRMFPLQIADASSIPTSTSQNARILHSLPRVGPRAK